MQINDIIVSVSFRIAPRPVPGIGVLGIGIQEDGVVSGLW